MKKINNRIKNNSFLNRLLFIICIIFISFSITSCQSSEKKATLGTGSNLTYQCS